MIQSSRVVPLASFQQHRCNIASSPAITVRVPRIARGMLTGGVLGEMLGVGIEHVPAVLDGLHPVSYTHLTLPTIYSV